MGGADPCHERHDAYAPAHDADYRRFVAPPAEPLERSVERTGQAQRAQILWLHEMIERWPEHAEEAGNAARAILRKGRGLSALRAGFAGDAVTADERTRATIARLEESAAEWVGSAGALLAGLERGRGATGREYRRRGANLRER